MFGKKSNDGANNGVNDQVEETVEKTKKPGFFARTFKRQKAVDTTNETAVAEESQLESVLQDAETVTSSTAPPSASIAPEPITQAAEPVESPIPPDLEDQVLEAEASKEDLPKEEPETEKSGFFSRMKRGLTKTRSNLSDGLTNLFIGKKEIDEELMEDIETQLLMADVGVEATTQIIESLTQRVERKDIDDLDTLYDALQVALEELLGESEPEFQVDRSKSPFVILVVGVNGVGKTTTIGKLAKRFQKQGLSVMLAAGDTFRAAAVEQLEVWGERNDIPVIAQHTGADSASVLFDGVEAAKARGIDVLLADTAGRLNNKAHLMEELKKVTRVMGKLDSTAPHETLLVLDAGTGQNALNQAKDFKEAVNVTGLCLTKLDGTAKGGIVFAVAKQAQLPIRFVGVGEQIDDLRPFNSSEFVRALFDRAD